MSDSKPYSRLTLRKRLGMELQHQLNKAFVQNHPLTQLFWECTLRCNLHCRHCGSDCRTVAQTPDMPGEDFLRVLDSVAARLNPNGVFVVITGGEPLVRDDLEYWGRKIYDKGFPWGIVTNGLYLTPERYEKLMAAGMHTLTVSLDGLEENHNWMRGNKLSFQRVSQALDILVKDPEIVFDVVTCATQRNFDELPRLKEFLIDKGVHHWRVFDVFPMGRAVENPETLLTNGRFRQLMDFIRDTRREGCATVSSFARPASVWARCWPTAPSRPVPASGATSIRAISTTTISWRCGRTASSGSATGSGCARGFVPTASSSSSAGATVCTCAMARAICCSAISSGWNRPTTRRRQHYSRNSTSASL